MRRGDAGRRLLAACLALGLQRAASAQSLAPRLDGELLRVSAPNLHFLAGKPLERLRNGAPVAFAAQLSLSLDAAHTVRKRVAGRFVVSYDLWEEKFSVSRPGNPPRSASRLTPAAAEVWCLDQLALPASSLGADQPFWLQLEVRAESPKESRNVVGEPGISLTRLIEIFSRPSRDPEARWIEPGGPFRLADLQRAIAPRDTRRPAPTR